MISQTENIDLSDQNSRFDSGSKSFRRSTNKAEHFRIDADGLPSVGQVNNCFLSSLCTV